MSIIKGELYVKHNDEMVKTHLKTETGLVEGLDDMITNLQTEVNQSFNEVVNTVVDAKVEQVMSSEITTIVDSKVNTAMNESVQTIVNEKVQETVVEKAVPATIRNTSTNLKESDTIYESGRFIYETDTNLVKIGDGVTSYNDLPYINSNNYLVLEVLGEDGEYHTPANLN